MKSKNVDKKEPAMQAKEISPDQYVNSLPEDRKEAITQLRKIILKNVPKGFQEAMSYGMLGYVVPHKLYPAGYHCNPELPLPFISLASQKNFIALYHMGMYADKKLLQWFTTEYPKHTKAKLDMGKSCIRFKKIDQIPYKLIEELVKKMTVKDWITIYEKEVKR
ncbi:MAG TPA: DUF1801 domain-containing protein [Leptospiraceae bacterium]|nr:DUF1801 domain-containing protein [Leptospiraceae bacterium]HRG73191.1 DUF1801 domain-containing protein [Leptospiraceae bacterium]